jgi:hypothetical protein
VTPADPARIVGLIDLTSLDESDSADVIGALCDRAVTPLGPVAAVCVLPRFVAQCADRLDGTGVRIATVANFPGGEPDPDGAARTTAAAGPGGRRRGRRRRAVAGLPRRRRGRPDRARPPRARRSASTSRSSSRRGRTRTRRPRGAWGRPRSPRGVVPEDLHGQGRPGRGRSTPRGSSSRSPPDRAGVQGRGRHPHRGRRPGVRRARRRPAGRAGHRADLPPGASSLLDDLLA